MGYLYGAINGNAVAGWTVYQFTYNGIAPPVTFQSKRVIVSCINQPLDIAFSVDGGVTYADTILVRETDPPIPYDITATHVRYRNNIALNVSTFQIVGEG